MKKIIPILSLFLFLISCNQQPQNNVTIQPNQPLDINVSANNIPGFSVNNFVKLLKVTKDPQSLQDAINSPGNDINNLDLNHDGQVYYLKVVEQNGSFQVIDDYSSNQSTVVATLTINQQNNTLSVAGNQAYCGDNYIYQSHFSLGDYLLLSYVFHPHPYYVSPYHYGYYPPHYHTRTVIRRGFDGHSSYQVYDKNRNANVINQRNSISNPEKSQRQFQVRDNSPVRSGGFGNKPNNGFGSSRSFGSGRSSFGSGRSSFGRKH